MIFSNKNRRYNYHWFAFTPNSVSLFVLINPERELEGSLRKRNVFSSSKNINIKSDKNKGYDNSLTAFPRHVLHLYEIDILLVLKFAVSIFFFSVSFSPRLPVKTNRMTQCVKPLKTVVICSFMKESQMVKVELGNVLKSTSSHTLT